ncbi:ABC-type nitrate/sulfonate/bicarbonate transport system, permease component [Paraburkholderia fungorum]|uniref:ABC-type nitrate/sulfonate/bicarbonate transport system, permease component n=1 Tax=Paraburkholderia fungorum TaxID=134537 RepID=A0A1H1JBL6_9BURK|nr:ABC-type nitrate/sulfonate/bicarbonate transport system, permease component [Paraburkholderia fungorum]
MRELASSTPPQLSQPGAEPGHHAVSRPATAAGVTVGKARGEPALRDLLVRITPPVVVVLVLLLIWEGAVRVTGVAPEILPAPSRVIEQGWLARGDLWDNTLPTLYVTLIGFSVSLVIGWGLAVAIDFSEWLRRGLMPLLVASQTIPVIAIAPLVIIWFGFGLLPKVLVIALVTFFPVTVGLVEGFDSADRESANLVKSMGGNRWKLFCYVRLPSALPAFFTALRISITYAVTGAIFAEYVGAEFGLGIYMGMQKNAFRTDLVLAAVIVTAILSVALFCLTYAVEYAVVPWHIKARRRGK